MRVFKTQRFLRFAKQEGISDAALCEAVARAEKGLIDATLGGGVIKQRIARPHQGRSGGYRTILFFKAMERVFFVYGFAKSYRSNLRAHELVAYKKLAVEMLGYTDMDLTKAIQSAEIVEVPYHAQDEDIPQ